MKDIEHMVSFDSDTLKDMEHMIGTYSENDF